MVTEAPFGRARAWLDHMSTQIDGVRSVETLGRVTRVTGTLVEARVPDVKIGEMCELAVSTAAHGSGLLLEAVGFHDNMVMLSPFGSLEGVGPGMPIRPLGRLHRLVVGPQMLGRVLDGFGNPTDGPMAAEIGSVEVSVRATSPPTDKRRPIDKPVQTGVRAIDGLLTLGRGQRMGVFAGPGCGKTTLMQAIAKHADVDVVVFSLIGERGRELAEMAGSLEENGLKHKAVIVGSTSDKSAAERIRAAYTATAIAEGFREQGKHVLLMIDSLTRFARAVRETSIAAGEPLGSNGLPASLYAELPRLVERAGNTKTGAITALYMVLVEGTVKEDPIADEVRSLVDGHILLSRSLADKGVFPAIDLLESLSRIMPEIVAEPHLKAARRVRRLLSRYQDVELLVRLGEIEKGADKETDLAVAAYPDIMKFLEQNIRNAQTFSDTIRALGGLAQKYAG
jgi:type III secretion protein N (ATPase)